MGVGWFADRDPQGRPATRVLVGRDDVPGVGRAALDPGPEAARTSGGRSRSDAYPAPLAQDLPGRDARRLGVPAPRADAPGEHAPGDSRATPRRGPRRSDGRVCDPGLLHEQPRMGGHPWVHRDECRVWQSAWRVPHRPCRGT